ncbi:hypothetical protein BKA62DRAFT_172311 [Auriculariales sp. MPI-PUGE-AT-0066]|nr:hypothetical protein BKA62DRAFT_172311 [Auriculariales sp. MPI-PUGE-AT-0066]
MQSNATQISSTFHPRARFNGYNRPPDAVVVSMDNVLFFVHLSAVAAASTNAFAGQIHTTTLTPGSRPTVLVAAEATAALEVVLHTMYGLPIQHLAPTFATLQAATTALLHRYAVAAPPLLAPSSSSNPHPCPLFAALLSHAAHGGIPCARDVYTLAARNRLEPLAVAVSEHLISFDTSTISDDFADALGGVYLRRLVVMLMDRTAAFKQIVIAFPGPLHPEQPACRPSEQQNEVLTPWAFASAKLITEARADMSTIEIETSLNPLAYRCTCTECRQSIQAQIRHIVQQWAAVKVCAIGQEDNLRC